MCKNKSVIFPGILLLCVCSGAWLLLLSGCAQIGMPTGGARDSVPPVLLKAIPAERSTNFTADRITLYFDEYIDVQDIQNNLLVSPFPKSNPSVSFKLKTVTIKLKDTLKPNTTYSINFGTSLKDLNEGNPFRNYTYVFSTGNTIDSFRLRGKVIMAESGKTDSTLIALLYRDAPDSAVQHRRPDYIAKVNGEGNFEFVNLSAGNYKIYALRDADGGKTYNVPTEDFAFLDSGVLVTGSNPPVTLYASAAEKEKVKPAAANPVNAAADKKFKYNVTVSTSNRQSLITPLELTFNRVFREFDEKKIKLTDTSFNELPGMKLSIDSTGKKLSVAYKWAEDADYRLIVASDAVKDTTGATLAKTDTLSFKTKPASDYGNLLLRFPKFDSSKHMVLWFFKSNEFYRSVPVTAANWNDKLFEPGEYELRLLYDQNNNGIWDPGNYSTKRQPEKVITLPRKLTVRARWDNEKDIELQ